MKGVIRFLILAVALGALPGEVDSGAGVASAQRSRRRIPARGQRRAPRVDYSKFLHATKQHQATCITCHKIPTSNSQRIRGYPDVADYPGHDACVSCHRQQFFRGARPPICSVCHSKVSPKDDVRFAFRNPASKRQFQIEFPHDRHQDVIARLFKRFQQGKSPRFVYASLLSPGGEPQDQMPRYNNCEICHGPRDTPTRRTAAAWTDGFVPDNLTLKSVPVNHAVCFSCHWKSEQPINENCAGCHKLPTPPAMVGFVDFPKRISMKFRHGLDKHIAECTTCHINITRAATLRGLKPDVPITSCSECHNKAPTHLEISNELAAIDKRANFVCVYCHTSDIGKLDPPASHYQSAERPPVKRRDIK